MAVAAKYLNKAIVDMHDGANGATLRELLGSNKFFYDQAPATTTLPFIVFHFINISPYRKFNAAELEEDLLIQFSIFDSNRNVDTIWNIYDALDALYDKASVSVTGYTTIILVRESVIAPIWIDKVWQMSADYRWQIQKS